jgi:hypothetical protein
MPFEVHCYEQEQRDARGTFVQYLFNGGDDRNIIGKKLKFKSKDVLRELISSCLENTCRGFVDDTYVTRQMVNNQIILIFYDPSVPATPAKPIEMMQTRRQLTKVTTPEQVPIGFVLARIDGDEFYIDVICSVPKYGHHLIQFCINMAVMKRMKSIGLSALPSVLGYYPRFGFSHRRSCKSDRTDVKLPENINQRIRAKTPPLPRNAEEAYNDEQFMPFMIELTKKGFADATGDDIMTNNCHQLTDKDTLKRGDCGKNGFYMKKCL